MKGKFRLGAKPLIAAVVAAVMVAAVAVGALTVGTAQAKAETCPDGGAWTKIDGLSGHTYEFTADSGKVIVEICWKNGTNVEHKVIDPPQTTVNLDITGEQNELSHASMKQQDQPTATPVTPTATPDPTVTPEDPTATPEDPTATPRDPTATPRPTQTPGPPDDNAGPADGGLLPIFITVAMVSGLMVLNNARRWYLSR